MSMLDIKNVSVIFSRFKYERLRLDREIMNLDFLIECKSSGVIPNFLKSSNSILVKNCPAIVKDFEFKCLNAFLRKKQALVYKLQKRTFDLHWDMVKQIPSEMFDILWKKLDVFREKQLNVKKTIHLNKLIRLSKNVKTKNKDEKDNPEVKAVEFINISSKVLNQEEVRVLNRGPKFVYPLKPDLKCIIPDIESIIHINGGDHKDELRSEFFQAYKGFLKQRNKNDYLDFKIIKNLRQDPNIIIIQTDKSNKLAILDTADYKSKMIKCINDMDCEIIARDPLNKLNNKIKDLISNGTWPTGMRKHLIINKTAVIPRIIGRLKDHKENKPVRPIVTKCVGPTYYLEKAYVPILKCLLPPSDYTVNSTSDFIEKLKVLQPSGDFLMASLDIVSLYPSIDTIEVNDQIHNIIEQSTNFSGKEKITLKMGLDLIINNNFFVFDGTIYKQNYGAPMGSPISGLLAEFKLRPLEVLIHETFTKTPHCWLRYADDIFIIWKHSLNELEEFRDQLNTLDEHIKFTLEVEKEGTLPFLDVSLQREGGFIARTVYRKPIASQNTIPNHVHLPIQYKFSAYRYYIRRAFQVCSNRSNLHKELKIIKQIAVNNGYHSNIIDKLVKEFKNTQSNPNISLNSDFRRFSFPYFPGLFEKLKRVFRKFKIELVAKPPPKLKELICKKTDPIDPSECAGVYMIPFIKSDNTNGSYIGMTSRKFSIRKKEHIADIKYGRLSTALARTFLKDNININFSNSKIIYRSNKPLQSLIRESLEVINRGENVCNDTISFKLPGLWLEMLKGGEGNFGLM